MPCHSEPDFSIFMHIHTFSWQNIEAKKKYPSETDSYCLPPFHSFSRLVREFSVFFILSLTSPFILISKRVVFIFFSLSFLLSSASVFRTVTKKNRTDCFTFVRFTCSTFSLSLEQTNQIKLATEMSKWVPKHIQQTNGKYFCLLVNGGPKFRYTSRHRYNSLGVVRERINRKYH